ncbi:COX15/CtaA family protein [Sphingomonas sp.]|jgi:cytochrome c oxidase assembly protein subunit 15|uniref:COX15/CtaA family protein n=1 Tax=Sphingomonas sp. TaxID=28214 RepID=UPI002EDAD223
MLQASAAFLSPARPRAVARWLILVAALIVVMVVVGGITRLTNSGLSITQWKPVTGIVPPLNDAQWQAEFANYKRIPEYRQINAGMTLAGFKAIFFWEYLHRALGRVIGLAFALPLVWFAIRRRIPAGYGWRLTALLALGGLQGAIGWWMVASGLAVRTDVSHVRLAVHLLTALTILAGIVWTALDLLALHRDRSAAPARLRAPALAALALLFVQLLYGAFTAGLDAGYAFASWPLMGDALFPAGVPMADPAWRNAIDNPLVVQFIHRWFAFAAAAGLTWLAVRAWQGAPRTALIVVALVVVQMLLGIATLLSGVQIDLAVAHQGNAALLLIATVCAAHALGSNRAR